MSMTNTHDCKEELTKASLHITPARIAAMQLFELHDKPVDAQYICNQLQKKLGIDRVTVFRILNIFLEKGLIKKLEFQEGKARYELASKEDHHHLICEQCGKIEDITDTIIPSFTAHIEKEQSFLVKRHSLEFFGICSNCQK